MPRDSLRMALSLRFRYGGRRLRVRATHDAVVLECDGPVPVRMGRSATVRCDPPGATFSLDTSPDTPSGPAGRTRAEGSR